MTPVEILALGIALYAGIKLVITYAINPDIWFGNLTKRGWKNSTVTSVVALALAAVSLYFLLQELTIIQIAAATVFGFALVVLGFAPYGKEMLPLEQAMFSQAKKAWPAAIVWGLFVIWILYALFV